MKKVVLIFLFFLQIISCSSESGGGDSSGGGSVTTGISFISLEEYINDTQYYVQGAKIETFDLIEFYSDRCTSSGFIQSANAQEFDTGVYIPVKEYNSLNSLYYKVVKNSETIVSCTLLIEYTHDNIPPLTNPGLPSAITSYHGTTISGNSLSTSIPSSYFSDFTTLNLFADSGGTQSLGELTADNQNITLVDNSANLIYYSFSDRAGNKSSTYASSTIITADSIGPATPSLVATPSLYTNQDDFFYQVNASDANSYLLIFNGVETNYSTSELETGVTLTFLQNQANSIRLYGLDEVGNRSNSLLYNVTHDNIAPNDISLNSSSLITNISTLTLIFSEIDYQIEAQILGVSYQSESSTTFNLNINTLNATESYSFYNVDQAGNKSNPLVLSITHDNIAPSAISFDSSVSALDLGYSNSDSINLIGNIDSDTNTLVFIHDLETKGLSVSDFVSTNTVNYNQNTVNTFTVTPVDLAGNTGPSSSISITHDNIAPNIGYNFPTTNTITSGATIQGFCETGLDVEFYENGVSTTLSCISSVFSYTIGSYSEGTNVTTRIVSTDLAGNTSDETISLIIDTTPPNLYVDTDTIVALTNDPNHIIYGYCETGTSVYIDLPSSTETANCTAGMFVYEFNMSEDVSYTFTVSQTDVSGNLATDSFTTEFDFTPPNPPVFNGEYAKINGTTITDTSVTITGTQDESLDVNIYQALNQDPIETVSYASFVSGHSISLSSNQLNTLYLVVQDAAGNDSDYLRFEIYQKDSLSKYLSFETNDDYEETYIAKDVSYTKRMTFTNSSYDADSGYPVTITSISASSSTAEIVVDATSDCLTRTPIYAEEECTLDYTVTYTEEGIQDDTITFDFESGSRTQDHRVYLNQVLEREIGDTGYLSGVSANIIQSDNYLETLNQSTHTGWNLGLSIALSGSNYCVTNSYYLHLNNSTQVFSVYDKEDLDTAITTDTISYATSNVEYFTCAEDNHYAYAFNETSIIKFNKTTEILTYTLINDLGLDLDTMTPSHKRLFANMNGLYIFIGENASNEVVLYSFDDTDDSYVVNSTHADSSSVDLVFNNDNVIVYEIYNDISLENELYFYNGTSTKINTSSYTRLNYLNTNYQEVDINLKNRTFGYGDYLFWTEGSSLMGMNYDLSSQGFSLVFDEIKLIGEDTDSYYFLIDESGTYNLYNFSKEDQTFTLLYSPSVTDYTNRFVFFDNTLFEQTTTDIIIQDSLTSSSLTLTNPTILLTTTNMIIVDEQRYNQVFYWNKTVDTFDLYYTNDSFNSNMTTNEKVYHYQGRIFIEKIYSSYYQIIGIPLMLF